MCQRKNCDHKEPHKATTRISYYKALVRPTTRRNNLEWSLLSLAEQKGCEGTWRSLYGKSRTLHHHIQNRRHDVELWKLLHHTLPQCFGIAVFFKTSLLPVSIISDRSKCVSQMKRPLSCFSVNLYKAIFPAKCIKQ